MNGEGAACVQKASPVQSTCAPGNYMDTDKACQLCPAGTYQDSPGTATECMPCTGITDTGADQGATKCQECASNIYEKPEAGANKCDCLPYIEPMMKLAYPKDDVDNYPYACPLT